MPRTSNSSQPSEEKKKPKQKPKQKPENFSLFIYKKLKSIHPDIGISEQSMSIMNSFLQDIFQRICFESSNLVRISKKHIMTAKDVQSAVKLILTGDLSRWAMLNASKALKNASS